jgi:hypothetical protein
MTKGVYVENLTEEPAESAVAVTSILQVTLSAFISVAF